MPGRLNDGSGAAPRMRPTHALWGLMGLPRGGPEWTMDEKFRRAKEAGFEAVECWPDAETGPEIKAALDRNGLGFGFALWGPEFEPIPKGVALAQKLGAGYMNLQPGHSYMSDEEMVSFVRDVLRLSDDTGFPIFLETHRGRLTENLYRVWKLIEKVPEIRFTLDISHYMVGSEGTAMTPEHLAPILERAGSFHARVSNGQQVQVDAGNGDTKEAQLFVHLWSIAMRHWRQSAKPGDVLPFVAELGPPTYSITDLQGNEVSDRWEQSLVMKRMGEEAWRRADG